MSLQRNISRITVGEIRIAEVERDDWCPACFLSSQLKIMSLRRGHWREFFKKIFKEDTSLVCNVCHKDFNFDGSKSIHDTTLRLGETYPEGDIVMVSIVIFKKGQKKVLAVAGEHWRPI